MMLDGFAGSHWRKIQTGLLACALATLIGCGDKSAKTESAGEETATEAGAASSARPTPDVPDEFEFLRYASNTDSVAPELCLTFSKALDPDADYSGYLDMDGSAAIQIDGSRMCLGGLAFGESRELTLRKGLPSAAGDALEADESLTLTFDDRPPVVAFAGAGIILPRIDADGLAITTVNVDDIDVKISRVNDRALVMRAINEGFDVGSDEYYYDYGDDTPGQFGVPVWEGTVSTAGPTNGTVTTVFPFADVVGEVEPGAYYVQINDATASRKNDRRVARAGRWIISTDLALTAYRGDSGADVTVRSLQTANPVGGTEVRLIAQSNEVLAEKVTDRRGQVRFDRPLMKGEAGNRAKLVFAFGKDGDFAMLDLDRSPVDMTAHPIGGRYRSGNLDGYAYLDRGIYRPGESVKASLLLRDGAGRAVTDRAGAMVLYKPNGMEQDRIRFDGLSNAGGTAHTFDLPDAAVRGSWRLAIEMDGVGTIQSVYFSVEDFVPQRIEIDLDADDAKPMVNADPRMVEVQARFLYGAPGAGLTVDGTGRVQRDYSPFDAWKGYSFGLHDESFSEILVSLPTVVTDGAGKAAIPVSAGRRAAGSTYPLRVRAVIEVEEPGGRTVADDVRIPYRPRDIYYGLKSNAEGRTGRNEPVSFEAIAVDRDGTAQAAELTWRVVRRDYDYDWYRVDGGQWKWRRSERIVPIEEGVVRPDADAPATINSQPLGWGDYRLIVAAGGEDVASTSFWVGWGGYTQDGDEAPDEVRVSLVNEDVSVGDSAKIAIRAPYAGRADVVVATDRVLSIRQIDVPEQGTEIDLGVDADWGAGAYVMVTVHTPRDRTSQPRPRRAVGVTYVPVNVGPRTFDVEIDLPEKVSPNQELSVPLHAQGGPTDQTIYVTIAAVDEGILQLTKFQTPDPAEYFFGKTALGVSLYDDYGRLLDPNQGAAAPVRSGGDQIGGAGLTVVPTKTVALFEGPVDIGRDGKGSIDLTIPDFNGKLRVMTVAWSNTAVGAGEHGLIVRDAVPAELILPRFLSPGDKAQATLTLDNVEGAAGDYAVSFAADGPITFANPSKTMTLDQGARKDEGVQISATGVGIAGLSLDVEGPQNFTADSAYPIEVRAAHWPETRVTRQQLAPGESYTPLPDLLGGFVDYSGTVQVSLSATPINVSALFKSLYAYPYACTEQLTSRMIPLLYAQQLSQLAGGEGPDGAASQVRKAIETILSRQSADGSFGLWQIGDRNASPWLGAYATDFLTRAAAAGYPVPKAALARAMDALDPVANGQLSRAYGYDTDPPNPRWSDDTRVKMTHRSSAYASYVLARNGRGDRSRLRYMHDELRDEIESPMAMAHIGAGLAAMGDMSRARSAFASATTKLGYENKGDWYQSQRRDLAGVLALAAEAGVTDAVTALTVRVTQDLPEADRLTTQEKAFLIMAARAIAGDNSEIPVEYSGNTEDPSSVIFNQFSIEEAGTFTNTGDQPLYMTVLAEGSPAAAPPASSEDLRVEKQITDLSGRPVDLADMAQGDRLIVSVTVSPQRRALAQYMLVDLLPAGVEIEAIIRPDEAGDTGPYSFLGALSAPMLSEARDDRFVAAFNGSSTTSYQFAYLARAVTAGSFTLPGAIAEDMYKPDVFARSSSGQVVITP